MNRWFYLHFECLKPLRIYSFFTSMGFYWIALSIESVWLWIYWISRNVVIVSMHTCVRSEKNTLKNVQLPNKMQLSMVFAKFRLTKNLQEFRCFSCQHCMGSRHTNLKLFVCSLLKGDTHAKMPLNTLSWNGWLSFFYRICHHSTMSESININKRFAHPPSLPFTCKSSMHCAQSVAVSFLFLFFFFSILFIVEYIMSLSWKNPSTWDWWINKRMAEECLIFQSLNFEPK